MPAVLELYDTTGANVLADGISIGNQKSGTIFGVVSFRIKNSGDETATDMRIFARCVNGLYTEQVNDAGQEIVTEQMIQARANAGAWQAIGGDFSGGSTPSPAGNFLAISNLAAGATSDIIDVQMVLPVNVESAGNILFGIGMSFQGEVYTIMGTIVAGDLITPAFFQDQNTDGTYKQLTLENSADNFDIKRSTTNLVRIKKLSGVEQGTVQAKGAIDANEDLT